MSRTLSKSSSEHASRQRVACKIGVETGTTTARDWTEEAEGEVDEDVAFSSTSTLAAVGSSAAEDAEGCVDCLLIIKRLAAA